MRARLGSFFSRLDVHAMLAPLIGLIAFVAVTGGRIIRPRHIDWLLDSDPATFFLGWHFFRHTQMLQFPLGANPDYGTTIGSSIVFSDSVPLLAFLFKPFSALLPDVFQYFGIWILACFMLQTVFAYRLLALFTPDKWLRLIGSAFFALAPVLIWRLYGHYALFGQWVLVAGLYLYFSGRFSSVRWTNLLCMTALIHAYLLVMLSGIWLADLLQRRLRNEISIARIPVHLVIGGAITVIVMWLAGYFMVGSGGLKGVGSEFYRMNLLSLIDPDQDWSRVLPDLPGAFGDYEGFNYLGLGVIVLALIAGWQWIRNPRMPIDRRRVAPIFFLALGLAVLALSHHVAFGRHELFSYPLSPFLTRVAETFRAPGRMFWPVYYMIYLTVFWVVFNRLRPRVALILCVAMLCLQVLDTSGALLRFRGKFSHAPQWTSPLQSPLWGDIARRYKNIVFVLPHNAPSNYLPLGLFAANNRMTINVGYFARVSPEAERKAQQQVASAIEANNLDSASLYVFEDDRLWGLAVNQAGPADVVGVVDGFRIVAPKLNLKTAVERDR